MFTHLSKEERLVLMNVALVLFIGTVFHYAFKQYPHLKDIVNVVESPSLYPKVDINRASYEELVDVPYIGPATANSILRARRERGRFSSIEELKDLAYVRGKNFEKFKTFIEAK